MQHFIHSNSPDPGGLGPDTPRNSEMSISGRVVPRKVEESGCISYTHVMFRVWLYFVVIMLAIISVLFRVVFLGKLGKKGD